MVINKDGTVKVAKKELTDRGHVMISERDAMNNNLQTRFNFLYYELAKDQPNEKKAGRPPKEEK